MTIRSFYLLISLFAATGAFAQKPLPLSEIDIPIVINLQPLYHLAEKSVDTVFTSPSYPKEWVQKDCATRYKYRFRRSPLRLQASGNSFQLRFTGFYKIIGATRVCAGGVALSPWAPECSCGFNEAERRVEVGFQSTVLLLPDYRLKTTIARTEPKALDKCSMCFWGLDVTTSVMDGLKAELDAAKKAIEDSFGVVALRPKVEQIWSKLAQSYAIPSAGYFQLHPKGIRMEQLQAKGDELQIRIGITAAPAVSFIKDAAPAPPLPNLSKPVANDGFAINLEAALQYDSLSRVLNGYLAGKRFEISEGLIKNHVIVENTAVSADTSGNLLIRVAFSGSFNGTVFFTGRPVYDAATKTIMAKDLRYELKSKSFLLNTAKWLFNQKIISELKKQTVFPMQAYYDTAKLALNGWLNREWTKGIQGEGAISELTLAEVEALPQHLLIRSQCTGKLLVRVREIDL